MRHRITHTTSGLELQKPIEFVIYRTALALTIEIGNGEGGSTQSIELSTEAEGTLSLCIEDGDRAFESHIFDYEEEDL